MVLAFPGLFFCFRWDLSELEDITKKGEWPGHLDVANGSGCPQVLEFIARHKGC